MKRVKIMLAFILAVCSCSCMTACGKENVPEPETSQGSAAAGTQNYTKYEGIKR